MGCCTAPPTLILDGGVALASVIAKANAQRGKRVFYLALEGEEAEIERRLKYQLVSERLWASPLFPQELKQGMNFLDWYSGRLDDTTVAFEAAVDKVIGKSGITIYMPGAKPGRRTI